MFRDTPVCQRTPLFETVVERMLANLPKQALRTMLSPDLDDLAIPTVRVTKLAAAAAPPGTRQPHT
jgi:hypothetical protein